MWEISKTHFGISGVIPLPRLLYLYPWPASPPHADPSLWGSLLLGSLSLVGGCELPTATHSRPSSCHSRLRNCTQRETVQFPSFNIWASSHPQTCLSALPVVSNMTRTHPLWDPFSVSCLLVLDETPTASFFVGSRMITEHRTPNDPRGTYAQVCYRENPIAGSTVFIELLKTPSTGSSTDSKPR